MSEQLEAAIESLKHADEAIEDAENMAEDGHEDAALTRTFDSLGHVRVAVNHLAGAVQELVTWRAKVNFTNALESDIDTPKDIIG